MANGQYKHICLLKRRIWLWGVWKTEANKNKTNRASVTKTNLLLGFFFFWLNKELVIVYSME